MKRFLSFVLVLFAFLPVMLFSACGENKTGINMSRYFSQSVSYTLYGANGTQTENLSHFTGSKADKPNKYLSVTFTGENAWIYKMTVEKIEFDVFSNIDTELQFIVRVSNLKNGDLNGYQEPKFTVPVDNIKAGKTAHVEINVNDYFASNSATTSIVIELDGAQHYFANGEETGLQIDIINFSVKGEHKL
ncbi:MAG: hypothetical protein IJS74_03880 [Clostridia bacterium]|nr:hypothetical protein [Clostridia bacterium]